MLLMLLLFCFKGGGALHGHVILVFVFSPECLNIRINLPPGDPYFPPTYIWMNFVRSLAAISSSCIPGKRI